jgi:hypothetical protein
MSSDSGESHTSAHDENDAEIAYGSNAPDSSVELMSSAEAELPANNAAGEDGQQELDSLDSGSDGLTFATRRASQKEAEEKELLSNLARQSLAEGPGSPDTASIPDDTPSIQVSVHHPTREPRANEPRAPDYLRRGVVSRLRIVRCALTDLLRYSPSSVASPPDSLLPR